VDPELTTLIITILGLVGAIATAVTQYLKKQQEIAKNTTLTEENQQLASNVNALYAGQAHMGRIVQEQSATIREMATQEESKSSTTYGPLEGSGPIREGAWEGLVPSEDESLQQGTIYDEHGNIIFGAGIDEYSSDCMPYLVEEDAQGNVVGDYYRAFDNLRDAPENQ
jgi:hypothetical protein